MKVWVEYHETEGVPGLGDRSIVFLDGRQKRETWIADGHAFNGVRRKKYSGFRIVKGTSLLTGEYITEYISCV